MSVDQPDGSVELTDEYPSVLELRDVRRDGCSPDREACLHLGGEFRGVHAVGDQKLLDDRALDRITQEAEQASERIVWQFGNG